MTELKIPCSKSFKNPFLVVFLAAFFLTLAGGIYFFRQQDKSQTASNSSPSKPTFVLEGNVLSDPEVNNIEIISLPDGQFRMFYHKGGEIRSATSSDGKKFTLEKGSRLKGEMPATVKITDGRWRMYFVSGKSLKSAVSEDGLDFKVEEGVRLSPGPEGAFDQDGIIHPSIVSLPDGSFKLFYDGVSPNPSGGSFPRWRIMSATSKDGLEWSKDEGIRIPVPEEDEDSFIDMAFSSHGEYRDGVYYLYFTIQAEPLSRSGIYQATSRNGVTFTLDPEPLIARDPQYGDTPDTGRGGPKGMPQDPFLLRFSEGERLYYWNVEGGYFSALKKDN